VDAETFYANLSKHNLKLGKAKRTVITRDVSKKLVCDDEARGREVYAVKEQGGEKGVMEEGMRYMEGGRWKIGKRRGGRGNGRRGRRRVWSLVNFLSCCGVFPNTYLLRPTVLVDPSLLHHLMMIDISRITLPQPQSSV
jgi:hypothetical protein